MFDYLKFRAAAYKHKYDTAIETDTKRITYGKLSSDVTSLCNSLANMNLQPSALVMLADSPELAVSCLALSKAGFDRMLASPFTSAAELKEIFERFTPAVVFLPSEQLERLGPALSRLGCSCAVVTGSGQSIFPAQFNYYDLIVRNDYRLAGESEKAGGSVSFFYLSDKPLPELANCSAAFIRLPLCEKQGAYVLSEILYSGKRWVHTKEVTKKTVKKKKADRVFTDPSSAYMFADIGCEVTVLPFDDRYRRCGERLVDVSRLSQQFCAVCKDPVSVTFSGIKMYITLTLGPDAGRSDIANHPSVKAVKSAAPDILYGINCPKTFTVKQKTV